jgi:hypothetical protein
MKEIDSSFILKDVNLLKSKEGKSVYKLNLLDKDLRLDIFPKKYKWCLIQNFAYENGVNVAKEIFINEIDGFNYRISEYVDGCFLDEADDIRDVYIKSGEQIAKLNLVKPSKELMSGFKIINDDPNDYGLTNSDFSNRNAIYTEDKKVYQIDTDTFKIKKISNGNLDFTLVKPLIKYIKDRTKIDYFLEGYSKLRDTSKIIELCEQYNWTWKVEDKK